MADVLPHFKRDIDEVVLVPSDKGRFEVSVNDALVYSKLETGEFPEHQDVIRKVEKALKT